MCCPHTELRRHCFEQLATANSTSCLTSPPHRTPELRDPKDDYVLFLARAVGVDYIVSGDADLTDATLEPPAITPRQAIDLFGLH